MDKHFQWLDRKRFLEAILMMQMQIFQMLFHVRLAQVIDFCIRYRLFDRFHKSI